MHVAPQLYGVIGDPIAHSLSPLMHGTAFETLALPAVYMPWRIPAEKLGECLAAVRLLHIAGLSVTLPHKEHCLLLPHALDEISPLAAKVGAVNTLYWEHKRLCGHNTDVEGFLAPLAGKVFTQALVLGAGGAARAVMAGLTSLSQPPRILVSARRLEQAEAMARAFGVTPLAWEKRHTVPADVIINTTPLGLPSAAAPVSELPFSAEAFAERRAEVGQSPLAYDLIYSRTPFLQAAQAAGWETIDGTAMFLAQGAAQFRLWAGQNLPDAARLAVMARLYPEQNFAPTRSQGHGPLLNKRTDHA